MTYDEWIFRTPADDAPDPIMEVCDTCKGTCVIIDEDDWPCDCPDCGGTGEIEVEAEEPDGDYQYERRRDALMEE